MYQIKFEINNLAFITRINKIGKTKQQKKGLLNKNNEKSCNFDLITNY